MAVMDKDDTLDFRGTYGCVFPYLGGFCHVAGGKAGEALSPQVKDLVDCSGGATEMQVAENGLGRVGVLFAF